MSSVQALLFPLLFLLVAAAPQQKLPKGWKSCKRHDPQRDSCLRIAVEEATKSLAHGNPTLGVTPVDPFHFNKLSLGDGDTGNPVALRIDFTDLDLIGISTVSVNDVSTDWDSGDLRANVTFGKTAILLGDYIATGKVLVLPINGAGKCKISFENFAVNLKLQVKEYTKNKVQYFDCTKMEVDIYTTRFRMEFENLFKGNKQISDQMNVFVNENWEDILKELKPSISRSFGEAFRQITNRIFSRIPADVIAPK